MVDALTKGDKVITAGGLMGIIDKIIDDRIASVQISENVKVKVVRSTITEVVSDKRSDQKK